MAVSFELPRDIEQQLRRDIANLDETAKEAALVELYRQNQISHLELARALNLSRYETDGVLKKHNVTEDSLSVDEFRAQLKSIDQRRGE